MTGRADPLIVAVFDEAQHTTTVPMSDEIVSDSVDREQLQAALTAGLRRAFAMHPAAQSSRATPARPEQWNQYRRLKGWRR